jgi:hypothetical protein
MSAYLPWLFIFACPLMMMWMMRGMGRSGNKNAPPNNSADIVSGDRVAGSTAEADDSGARIAELEREVAELRAGRLPLDNFPRGGSASRP